MNNKLEKRLQQKDINQTPKVILEELFTYMDEKRCQYEEQVFIYRKKITETKNIICNLKEELKIPGELTINEIKGIKLHIENRYKSIENYKKEIRLIFINCDILYKNELKMDKILGYGFE